MAMSSHNASDGMTFSGLPSLFISIKMATPKRERSDNFTVKETSVITEAFKDHRKTLHSRITNSITNQTAGDMEEDQHSECSWITKPDHSPNKDKWTNLVRTSKKGQLEDHKREKKKTARGSQPKPPTCANTANFMEMFNGTVQFAGLIGSETSVGRKSG